MIPRLQRINAVQSHYLEFLQALKRLPFRGDICPDYANRTVLSTDNSVYQILPQGVIYPADENDLVLICQLVDQPAFRDIVLSPRGGGTGTNGQSLSDGLVIDVSKHMHRILEINAEQAWVRVQSGVVKDQLNAALRPYGLFFAPELSTSNRATIGGMINTDASGQGSCLYGKTRDHVLELKTVLLDGTVIASRAMGDTELRALSEQQDKSGLIHRLVDNIHKEHKSLIGEVFPPLNRCLTGYDLAHIRDEHQQFNLNNIICGSEGTLGFVSEAKLKVLPIPAHTALAIVKYTDFDASLRDARELMLTAPTSIETIDSKVLNLAMQDFIWHQVEEFFTTASEQVQGINLVEFTASSERDIAAKIDTFTAHIARGTSNNDKRIAYSLARGRESVNKIWAMRKRAVGLLGNAEGEARPVPFVEDTAVPPEHLADFILEFREILDAYHLEYGMFGHVDAGVLHVRPVLDMKNPQDERIAWEISDRVADLTRQYHGLFWGEHGKGVRSEYAPDFFGELYPQLQRIKAAFDPHNQLNPGKIATPSPQVELLAIDNVPTRGQRDRLIPAKLWHAFHDAVYCNGNGACFNWDTADAMCPSWKATRERTQSPKGRASLLREWMTLLAKSGDNTQPIKNHGFFTGLNNLPEKIRSAREKKRGEYDFSHEVYQSMAGCLACKSCTGQCPVKVNVPEFRSQFLALYHTRYFRPLKDYLVGGLEFMLPYYAKVPGLYNAIMSLGLVQNFLRRAIGFVDAPRLSKIKPQGLQFADDKTLQNLSDAEKQKTIVIVQDAFTTFFEAQLLLDTYNLLRRLGLTPLVAPFAANGKPLHVHGFLSAFARTAKKNATLLNKIANHGLDLVGIDPSMTLSYQSEYRKYVTAVETPTVHLLQDWLVQNWQKLTPPTVAPAHFKLLPHCTESTNAASSVTHWRELFALFGHSLEIINVGCCGMSGTFGHEARNRATAQKLYTMSWQQHVDRDHGGDELLASGFSCRSQVKRESNKTLPHPVQALLKSIE